MTETIEEFQKRWNEKIIEIKKYPLDASQCHRINYGLRTEFMIFEVFKKNQGELKSQALIELQNDLNLVLDIAYTKYRLEFRKTSWWFRLFGGDKHLHLPPIIIK